MRERIPDIDRTDDLEEEHQKDPFFATRRGRIISAVFLIGIIIGFMALTMSDNGAVEYQLDTERIGIAFQSYEPAFISYQDIRSVELIDSFDMGTRIDGVDWNNGWCGEYESADLGLYKIYAYSAPGKYILIRGETETVIFNAKTLKQTENVFQELSSRCS